MTRPVHFEILAEDPDKTVKFYEEVVGWDIAKWGEGDQGYWPVTTGSGDDGINGGLMHRHFPQAVINTISVQSLDEMIAKVEAAGGAKVHGPSQIPGVGLHAYCTDPEGTFFGLLQPDAQDSGS